MLSFKVDDPTFTPRLQTKSVKPPKPPAGLAAVLVGSSDLSSELVVAIDSDGTMTVQLHAPRLEASGAARATVRRFRDLSTFALADVPIVGYDVATEHAVTGKVSVAVTWTSEAEDGSCDIAGSALADGSWSQGLLRFGVVAHHSFSNEVVRLVSTNPFPTGRPRVGRHQN
ncbi:MAG: hypothetical protein WBM50_03875 [Acidimicrobiales bacterium]